MKPTHSFSKSLTVSVSYLLGAIAISTAISLTCLLTIASRPISSFIGLAIFVPVGVLSAFFIFQKRLRIDFDIEGMRVVTGSHVRNVPWKDVSKIQIGTRIGSFHKRESDKRIRITYLRKGQETSFDILPTFYGVTAEDVAKLISYAANDQPRIISQISDALIAEAEF